ncbi:unnamed protein product [Gongylonema pulchrum]|uniref:Secreted protein n=1 Tax=Gongylonema pulchrum TaxID=637853 RepID=A0A183ENZ0_9BILA|nr:unnamed protein product [Gongylonema pulchrum]
MATCATAASTLFSLLLVLTFTCATVVRSKSVNRNTVLDDDDEMDASELIDSFLERAKQNTRHHRTHRLARRHRVQAYSPQLTSLDAHGREYVKCRKSMIEGGSVTRRCYRPPSDDMRVGCYAVWDMKTESLVQDCWVQQAVSLPIYISSS